MSSALRLRLVITILLAIISGHLPQVAWPAGGGNLPLPPSPSIKAAQVAALGGSNIGGSGSGSQFVADWCREALAVLHEARHQARLAVVGNDLDGASNILRQGLIQALEKEPQGHSLTQRALVRGIELSDALEMALHGDLRSSEARSLFYTQYYDFVLDTVSHLDLDFFIPYRARYPRHCTAPCSELDETGFDIHEYERRYVEYAEAQLRFVLSGFASRGSRQITPVYTAKVYLKLLELAAQNASYDLGDSLWSLRFSCARGRLDSLSLRLAHYNSGNHSVYSNDPYAVNATYRDAQASIRELQAGCDSRPYNR